MGTGNPIRQESAFPKYTRAQVRDKLQLAANETMVLAPGNKFAAGNLATWAVLMDALTELMRLDNDAKPQLILAMHPGDRTPFAVDPVTTKEMGLYKELVEESPVPARILTKDVLSTSDMIPGADLIVEFGSSIGIEAAYQLIPVVTLSFEILARRVERASGTREQEAVRDGISELVMPDAPKLARVMRRLLTHDGFAHMRECQQCACPKPADRGVALRNIADVLEKMVSRT